MDGVDFVLIGCVDECLERILKGVWVQCDDRCVERVYACLYQMMRNIKHCAVINTTQTYFACRLTHQLLQTKEAMENKG